MSGLDLEGLKRYADNAPLRRQLAERAATIAHLEAENARLNTGLDRALHIETAASAVWYDREDADHGHVLVRADVMERLGAALRAFGRGEPR